MVEQEPVFTPEELIAARKGTRWDGGPKDFTSDCLGCRFRLEEEEQTCEWGVAWKRLAPPRGKVRACALVSGSNDSPRLKRILKHREFDKRMEEYLSNIEVT